jgi:diguanylate cyclase (GGDEF)-like protein
MKANPVVEYPDPRADMESPASPSSRPPRVVAVSGCGDEMELLKKVAGRFNREISSFLEPGSKIAGMTAAIVGDDDERALETCRTLSASGPVILVTARDSLDFRLAASDAGVTALVRRPVNAIELSEWMSHFADRDDDRPLSVLIVDDDYVFTRVNAAVLRSAGIETAVINDPAQVLAYLERFVPDLVLMDVQMPDIDGVRLTRIIRQTRRFVSMPIVFLSSATDEAQQFTARRLGGDDFIMKPVAPQKLIEVVKLRIERSTVLRSMIERDRLTGLYNATSFRERLSLELERSRRSGGELSLAVIDIDHFKRVNDTHGHGAGDTVLRALAGILQSKLRRVDVVGRLGGEEFGVLLMDAGANAAGGVIDRLRIEFGRQFFEAGGHDFTVSFSAGVTSRRGLETTAEGMMLAADDALYAAKSGGRNNVVIAEEPQDTASSESSAEGRAMDP